MRVACQPGDAQPAPPVVTIEEGTLDVAPVETTPAIATVETAPVTVPIEAKAPVLRSKRSAEVAMDIDNPVPSKAAKSTSGSTAGSSIRVGPSTSSEGVSPVGFTSLTPRPRPRPVAASMSIASSSSSVDTSDELLLAIRHVRNTVQSTASDINTRVATFLGEVYGTLDDLEDKVLAARPRR